MLQTAHSFECSTNVEFLGCAEEVFDTGMCVIVAAKDFNGFLDPGEIRVSTSIRRIEESTGKECQD